MKVLSGAEVFKLNDTFRLPPTRPVRSPPRLVWLSTRPLSMSRDDGSSVSALAPSAWPETSPAGAPTCSVS